jgi:hypothetical protein
LKKRMVFGRGGGGEKIFDGNAWGLGWGCWWQYL